MSSLMLDLCENRAFLNATGMSLKRMRVGLLVTLIFAPAIS